MTAYLLRDVPDDAWEAFKARAEAEGRSRGLRFILLRLIALYTRVGLDVLEKAAAKEPHR